MADLTRRQLLGKSLGAATAGAALVGGSAVLPKLLATTAEARTVPSSAASRKSDLVVHVRPGASGEMRLMSGNHEVVVSDAALVSRLRRASAG
jgi:nitrous oxide reductase